MTLSATDISARILIAADESDNARRAVDYVARMIGPCGCFAEHSSLPG